MSPASLSGIQVPIFVADVPAVIAWQMRNHPKASEVGDWIAHNPGLRAFLLNYYESVVDDGDSVDGSLQVESYSKKA